jgi:DNA-directed RNA polymerase specialized sigma subunit
MGLTIDERVGHLASKTHTRDAATARETLAREVLTRDLLLRAAQSAPGECRALHFRALHLNLPLVRQVTDRLAPSAETADGLEHCALEGLLRALRTFDAACEHDFGAFAASVIESEVLANLPRPSGARLTQPVRRTPGPLARSAG